MMKSANGPDAVDVAKLAATVICVAAALCAGIAIGRTSDDGGRAPGATTESWGEFQPSDSPPRCLPAGTTCYEAYDAEADMRLWVFRWPDGSYQAVPRLAVDGAGCVVAYEPPRVEVAADSATTTTGAVEIGEET